MSDIFHAIIDFLAVTGGGQVPIDYKHYGHFIKKTYDNGFIGGSIHQIFTDHLGRLQAASATMSTVLGCSHLATSIDDIAGFCQICGRVCCQIHPECLQICELTGITVCNRHYRIKSGVVVSSIAQKGMWRLKARSIGKKKRELNNVRNQIPYRP